MSDRAVEARGSAREQDIDCLRELIRSAPPRPRLFGRAGSTSSARIRAKAERQLSLGTWLAVQQQSARLGVAPEAWLLSAVGCWLKRISGSKHLLLGLLELPVEGHVSALEQNTHASSTGEAELAPLLISMDLEANPQFQDLVREAGRSYARARDERIGAEDTRRVLSEELDAEGTLPVAALLRIDRGDEHISAVTQSLCAESVAVSLCIAEDRLVFRFVADRGAVDDWSASRSLEYLTTLVEGALVDPTSRIAKLPLLSAAERSLVLAGFQGLPLEYPQEEPFHRLFEEQVERRRGASAVAFDTEEWSYEHLNTEANRLAHVLRAQGIGVESRVGVYMDNSLELAVAVLAVFKAGGAYVPLSVGHARQHRDYVIGDTGLKIVLAQAGLSQELAGSGVHVIELPLAADVPDAEPATYSNLDVEVRGENLCAVLYTSGTTGTPKGVELSHQSLLSRVCWMQSLTSLDENDRHILISPMHVARFVGQFMWPLITGGRTFISRPGGEEARTQLPAHTYLMQVVRQQRLTLVHVGPTMVRMLLGAKDQLRQCTTLRHVFVSGESFPGDLQGEFAAQLPFAALHKAYGLAETNFVTYCRFGDPLQTATIGRPTYMRVYLVDEHLEPVPIGMPGEICCAGIGLARGFANKPDVTAQRFVQDPFADKPGALMYRTGDLARWQPDGNIEFLGRMAHQVTIRGYPVDLVELESHLALHPALQAAVVVVAADSKEGDPRLTSYVVPRPEQAVPPSAELRAFLAKRVPGYMVPAEFVTLEHLPTRAGKVDRQGLAALRR